MQRSAIADFEIKELLIRRRLLDEDEKDNVNLSLVVGLQFISNRQNVSLLLTAVETRRLGTR
jgi:helicase SWR1